MIWTKGMQNFDYVNIYSWSLIPSLVYAEKQGDGKLHRQRHFEMQMGAISAMKNSCKWKTNTGKGQDWNLSHRVQFLFLLLRFILSLLTCRCLHFISQEGAFQDGILHCLKLFILPSQHSVISWYFKEMSSHNPCDSNFSNCLHQKNGGFIYFKSATWKPSLSFCNIYEKKSFDLPCFTLFDIVTMVLIFCCQKLSLLANWVSISAKGYRSLSLWVFDCVILTWSVWWTMAKKMQSPFDEALEI